MNATVWRQVSTGYDAHWRDPLAGLQLMTGTYNRLARDIRALADRLCGGRVAFFLEVGPSGGNATTVSALCYVCFQTTAHSSPSIRVQMCRCVCMSIRKHLVCAEQMYEAILPALIYYEMLRRRFASLTRCAVAGRVRPQGPRRQRRGHLLRPVSGALRRRALRGPAARGAAGRRPHAAGRNPQHTSPLVARRGQSGHQPRAVQQPRRERGLTEDWSAYEGGHSAPGAGPYSTAAGYLSQS